MVSRSLYSHGFARVAAAGIVGRVGDPIHNGHAVLNAARACDKAGAALVVFPELVLSSYAIDDLLLQDALLDSVVTAAETLIDASRDLHPLLLVGAPLRWRHRLYNCALAIHRGRLLGIVPKAHLPNYREFYEHRHFASGATIRNATARLGAHEAPFGSDLLFSARDLEGFTVHAEICEDLWVPIPPSSRAALAGATVLANLSASNITIGKSETRHLLTRAQSARCLAAYIYAAAGVGESTTDLAWDGQLTIDENGANLVASERFPSGARHALADIDLDLLRQERARQGTFDDNIAQNDTLTYRTVAFDLSPPEVPLNRAIERFPFVPSDPARLQQDCFEAYNIQVSGLVQRLAAIGVKRVVIGVSGGLDSTHALIVAARAFDRLGWPRTDILAYTLPGFATSEATKTNAIALMAALGVSARELDIRPAANQMLADLGHPYAAGARDAAIYDVTFENVQAGLRTDYLFRLANQAEGIVLGTGDLSELALGWCTYGVGDQMSHYNVNGGVPKTLIQHLIRWVIGAQLFSAEVGAILARIVETEISPELVPVEAGAALQSTEAKIGPYALQDFNLFYTLRYGFRPSKIAYLAEHAWANSNQGDWPPNYPQEQRRAYGRSEILHWLDVFIRRFFAFSQFKRSALPNGPKVSAGGSLSPRGDWRAPSDGTAEAWLADLARARSDQMGSSGR
jgi:NAD+ synthase (glutamine-hydrolysing)